jgi:hypothetical protein
MTTVGLSPGDFYFVVTLIGRVVASFRGGPQGAAQQYSAFSAELRAVSNYLDHPSVNEPDLVALWEDAKLHCEKFTQKYAILDPKANLDGESKWKWLRRQAESAFTTVRWSEGGHQEALELQRKVGSIVHLTSLKIQQQNGLNWVGLEKNIGEVLYYIGQVTYCNFARV